MPAINVEDLQADLLIGNVANGDYTSFNTEGSMVALGGALRWEDLQENLAAKRLETTSGRLEYDYDNNGIIMQNNGDYTSKYDRLMQNVQIKHGQALTEMRLHIHWMQVNANNVEFTVQYLIQKNGDPENTVWTTEVFPSQTYNKFSITDGLQITDLSVIDISGCGVSDLVFTRVTRTDSTSGDITAKFIDFHVQMEAAGSINPWSK